MGLNSEAEKILEAAEAVVAGIPRVAKTIAEIPMEGRERAFKAAERVYQQTLRDLGYPEAAAQRWALAAMSRLRSQTVELEHNRLIAPARGQQRNWETKRLSSLTLLALDANRLRSALRDAPGWASAAMSRLRNQVARLGHKELSAPDPGRDRNHEIKTSPSIGFLLQSLSLALRALGANRLRSALTALGIVLGVAAVVCMIAVGEGARSQISDKIAKLGTNLLFVQPYSYAAGARHALTEDDAAALLREIPNVEISAPIIWGGAQVIAGNQHSETTVWGNDNDYLKARDWPLRAGRLFSREEIASGAKVAIIGQEIADKLLDGQPRIGTTIRLDSVPFTIVGVLEKKGETGAGGKQDDLVVIPLLAARSRVLGTYVEEDREADSDPDPTAADEARIKNQAAHSLSYAHQANYQALDYLVIKYDQLAAGPQVRQAIEGVLRVRHHTAEDTLKDFGIYDPADALATQEAAAKSFSWLLAAIASISLAVGGISIMNTMLVSVTERTREIGLRMAVGARRRDIRNQFLVEAVLLAVLGALAGTVLGVIAAAVIARYGGWPVLINPAVVLLACGCTSLVGVVFGSLPAIRASRLDPMVALRTE
jgi:putative ABC transport system permease protein